MNQALLRNMTISELERHAYIIGCSDPMCEMALRFELLLDEIAYETSLHSARQDMSSVNAQEACA